MDKEPDVKIIQATSEELLDKAKAEEYGIVDPSSPPGGGFGGKVLGNFRVRVHQGKGWIKMVDSKDEPVTCSVI